MNGLLDEGWRIATGPDLFYLLMRQNELGPVNASSDNPLFLADFLAMTSAIGITADGTGNPYAEPWACMYFYGDSDLCQLTNAWAFTPYGITAQAAFGDPALAGVTIDIIYYLTEVPLYGNFEIGVCDSCVGRTLLVRNVPLPAGAWLLLSGLAVLVPGRKRT